MSQIGLLQSLMYDMLDQMPQYVRVSFPQRWRFAKLLGQSSRDWTLAELVKGFKAVLKCAENVKLCLFIDGLDEFSGSHENLVRLLQEVVSFPNVKACLASRPWIVFEDAFNQSPNLQLQDLTYPDILKFTWSMFHQSPHFLRIKGADDPRGDILISAVARRAAGVFLWVDLAVSSLLSGLSNRDRMVDLQQRLDEVPPDFETFYVKMFSSIEKFYFQHACQLFAVVAESKADYCETIRRRLLSRCKGFLEIPSGLHMPPDVEENVAPPSHEVVVKISYLHRTARDFLESAKIKQQVLAGAGLHFSAAVSLFRSTILSLKTYDGDFGKGKNKAWDYIEHSFQHAAKCEAFAGQPQTRLLLKLDEVVTDLARRSETHHDGDNTLHWPANARIPDGANSFIDIVAQYNVPRFIMQVIRSSLGEVRDAELDKHLLLIHLVRDYKKMPGLCEWAGDRVPRLSFVKFLLQFGANPNHQHESVTAFELALCEAVVVSKLRNP